MKWNGGWPLAVPDAAVGFMLPLRSGMIVLCTLEGSNWRSERMELVFTCVQRKRLGCGAMAWSSQVPIPPAVIFVAHYRWLAPVWLVLAQRLSAASGIVAQFLNWQVCISQSIHNRQKIDLNIVWISRNLAHTHGDRIQHVYSSRGGASIQLLVRVWGAPLPH